MSVSSSSAPNGEGRNDEVLARRDEPGSRRAILALVGRSDDAGYRQGLFMIAIRPF